MPPTTTAPANPAVVGVDEAVRLLGTLVVAAEDPVGGYDRDRFDYPGGGTASRACNTRDRVLIRDSLDPPQVDYPGCKVLAGRCRRRSVRLLPLRAACFTLIGEVAVPVGFLTAEQCQTATNAVTTLAANGTIADGTELRVMAAGTRSDRQVPVGLLAPLVAPGEVGADALALRMTLGQGNKTTSEPPSDEPSPSEQ